MTYTPLDEIESYFKENPPTKQVSVEWGAKIVVPELFVKTNIEILRANSGNKLYNPYFKRLHAYYLYCKEGIQPIVKP